MSKILIDLRQARTPAERLAAVKLAVEPRNATLRAKHKAAVLEQVERWKEQRGRG